ncbi:flavin reductase family protein [Streptomyces sp. DH37]|uniref:flavin reductase family protein n=1 Tax=Streptomyces sp. DH37 TaxID=3040122 RepID=UPI002442FBAE|nr:flavin reductase family protein [Streptomyces sp. DH37]MDG9703209.1 flavin reductase family protein [Streptomyces sp. DH37]
MSSVSGAPGSGELVTVGIQQSTDSGTSRRALRCLASGVTVLTVNSDGLLHGTTVSSLVAISRTPLVLGACLRLSSGFTELARKSGSFSVNVLSSEQASVARWFASPDRGQGGAQFADVVWSTDRHTGAPLLDGSLAHMACAYLGSQRIGDHDLITAEVIAGAPGTGVPLLSFAGGLCQEGSPAPGTADL